MISTTSDNDWAIELLGVRKTYDRTTQALDGVDIRVGRGEIFGLLGPNGAGKSTLVKIMMTVVRPDYLKGTVLGQPVGNRPTMDRIGYLPESHRFPVYLTGLQLLDYYAALAGIKKTDRHHRAPELMDRLGVGRWGKTKIAKYSKGMLQRLGIAQSLMNNPDLVVLDEPTDGLDPIGRRDVRQLLLELKAENKTVFLNSHLLSELELVCDRVAILVSGKVARQGRLDDLLQDRLEYRIVTSGNLSPILEEILRLGGRVEGDTITLGGREINRLNELIDLLRSRGHLIESVTPQRFTLEDIFVQAAGNESPHSSAAPKAKPAEKRGGE